MLVEDPSETNIYKVSLYSLECGYVRYYLRLNRHFKPRDICTAPATFYQVCKGTILKLPIKT